MIMISLMHLGWHALAHAALGAGDQQLAEAAGGGEDDIASTSAAARANTAAGPSSGNVSNHLSPEELEFLSALNEDLRRINSFFIDKEEDAVIKLQVKNINGTIWYYKGELRARITYPSYLVSHGMMHGNVWRRTWRID